MTRPNDDLVRDQLERIVRSPTFVRSPQAVRFLRFAVEESIEGRGNQLKAFTIGVQALGAQGERSEPDSMARMQARRVRKLLEAYYATVGQGDALRIGLPTGTYRPSFESNTPRTAPDAEETRPTLIVEGYVTQAGTTAANSFAAALGELTAAALLSFGTLRVWRTSRPSPSVGAAFVLSGTLWMVSGRLRVFTALRDAKTGERLWYDRFDGSYSEGRFFEIQDEICDAVCARIGDPGVGVIARTLRARSECDGRPLGKVALATSQFHDHLLTPFDPGVEGALGLLEEALTEEPRSAPLLAAAALLGGFLYAADPREQAALLDEAEARARHAVTLQPTRYDAHLAKGLVHFHRREDEAARAELGRAIRENPRALASLYWGGVLAALMGDWELGLERLQLSTERFTDAPGFHHLALCLYHFTQTGDIEAAHRHAKLFDTPHTAWGPLLSAVCLVALGRRHEAKRALQEATSAWPPFASEPRVFLAGYLHARDTLDAVCGALEEIGLRAPSAFPPPPAILPAAVEARRRCTSGALPQRKLVHIGILHSLTGTMAICERPLVDAALLAVDEINEQGGVLGRQVVPFVEDGASQPDTFVSRARKLLGTDKAATLFGCWTSSSRKAVRSVLEHYSALLWYPVQYEGLEHSHNVIYTGSCLNQQIEPATRWALSQGKKRFFLVGSDYVFPRTANHLIRTQLGAVGAEVVSEEYQPLGSGSFTGVVELVRRFKPDMILNTINGADNLAFFAALTRAGLTADTCPVMSFSLSELDLAGAPGTAAGHFACWSYFQSVGGPDGALLERFRKRYGPGGVLSDPTVTAYAQVHLWKQVAEAAGSLRTSDLLSAVVGQRLRLGDDCLEVRSNHHVDRRALIGKVRHDGLFDVAWQSETPITPKPWLGVEESNLASRDLILGALGSLPDIVDYTTSLEHEIWRRKPPERGAPPRSEH